MKRSTLARIFSTTTAAGLTCLLAFAAAPGAAAYVPAPTVTPDTWPAGVSQSITVTMEPTSSFGANSEIGMYRAVAQGWSLNNPGQVAVAFDDATHTLTCANGITFTSTGFSGTVVPGDTCSVQDSGGQADIFVAFSPTSNMSFTAGSTITMTIPAGILFAPSNVGTSYEWAAYAGPYTGFLFITTVEGPAASSSPSDLIQQVPMPSSGSCAGIPDAALAWDSGVSGGWTSSWAEWARGPVCTRTLHYSHSLESWVVA